MVLVSRLADPAPVHVQGHRDLRAPKLIGDEADVSGSREQRRGVGVPCRVELARHDLRRLQRGLPHLLSEVAILDRVARGSGSGKGWLRLHIAGMAISYIVLLTAF
jgi:hypothetical protein